ncbi:hypothetical protein I7I53_00346 [Histoplasma capsulatum var. duboisii H88]|uniref:Uncharacterized protein n=1 Tax=Ajellomyces capsulatus (strain H88) TaxID=544711 RepID=A0A8A1LME3_AJEC8|nr:hypothetical protein I7I53_00346 [Histoplasma capsulatum var. duboisii H88]
MCKRMHPQPPTDSLTKCRVGEGFIGEKKNRLDGDTCKCPVPVFAVRACLEHRLQKRGKRQSGGGFGICQKLDLFTTTCGMTMIRRIMQKGWRGWSYLRARES